MKVAIYTRLFAFLAVSCTVAAVAWATRDPWLLAIGIAGIALGHYYSWHRRDSVAKHRTLLLLLLLVILTVYLSEEMVPYGISDRLLLSRYLIYGLVLGSFDLMKRRNVLASLILGGLLLVLISELALDPWFLVFPLLFTFLALFTVALSRVEAEMSRAILIGRPNWFKVGTACLGFTVGALLISAAFFLLMPRLAGTEIAQASWLPSRLDLSLGGPAVLPSKPSASPYPGLLPSHLEGQIPGREYATLGYTGSAADRAVMHVRSRVSSYWRGATLDIYDGRGWLPSSPQLRVHNQSRNEFILPDSNLSISGGKIYWQIYYLLSDQPNAVFTGYNPGRIFLPGAETTFLERGTLYRAISFMPRFRPKLLRDDSAIAQDISELALPPISERTAALAEAVVAGAPTDYDKAVRLERFLLDNYPYKTNVKPLPPGRDGVDLFLFEQQAGYCSHFASAMAVMARHVGLPARVAVGYLPGLIDPMTGAHLVRVGDAHAWVEIHFKKHGWVAFDPTPRPDAAMGFAAGRNWLYFGLEDFTGVTFASLLQPVAGKLSLTSIVKQYLIWAALAGVGVIIFILTWLLYQRRAVKISQEVTGYSRLEGETRRVMLKLYQKMITSLRRNGLPSRKPHQPFLEYANAISAQIPDGQALVEWLSQAASRAAYDPKPLSHLILVEARQRLSTLRQVLTRH